MSEEHPSADLFKVTAALILFVIAVIGGLLPRRAQKVGSRLVSCLNTAAGGVFFASAMVSEHMILLCSSRAQYPETQRQQQRSSIDFSDKACGC